MTEPEIKPCPNPRCVFPYPVIKPTADGYARKVVCPDCGCCGPAAASDAVTPWNSLPRAEDFAAGKWWKLDECATGPVLDDQNNTDAPFPRGRVILLYPSGMIRVGVWEHRQGCFPSIEGAHPTHYAELNPPQPQEERDDVPNL